MIRTMKRWLGAALDLSIGTHWDRVSLKESYQLGQHHRGRSIAVQQFQQLEFEAMVGIGTIDLDRLTFWIAPFLQSGLGWLTEQALQVSQQHSRMHILPHRFDSLSAKVFQFATPLEHQVKSLMSPAVMIDSQKLFGGIQSLIEQRGDQHFQFLSGQAHTDKTHLHFQRQPQAFALGFLIWRRKQPDHSALVGTIQTKQLLSDQKRSGRTPCDKVRTLLQNQSQ